MAARYISAEVVLLGVVAGAVLAIAGSYWWLLYAV